MKALILAATITAILGPGSCYSQGSLIYDQQSADEAGLLEGGITIQPNQPLGQSFIPPG
ncbi:MAG TPA: hypothetical protein VLT36_10385 [Candidatus Dormibacteraeota bacterium]|nr:hypothetical protein [Candidatus Dormibacteraeota bacterium]